MEEKYSKSTPTCAVHLSQMIKHCTISSRENTEKRILQREFITFHQLLKKLYPKVFRKMIVRVIAGMSLILYWKGRDSSKCIILTAHQDTVSADATKWKDAPFSGLIKDEKIIGRGALDDKGSLCAILEAAESLIASNFVPQNDIYLAFSHNEEPMGYGAEEIVEYFKSENIHPIFVLDEGGAIVKNPMPLMDAKTAMIGITEKGAVDIRFTAYSSGGHASTPPKKSPLGRLGEFAYKIEKKSPFKAKVTKPLSIMLKEMSPLMKFPLNLLFKFPYFFSPLLKGIFLISGGEAKALVKTTVAFTQATASSQANVLPDSASFIANIRINNNDTLDSVMNKLSKKAKKYNLSTELISGHEPSLVSPSRKYISIDKKSIRSKNNTPILSPYGVICQVLKNSFGDVIPIPYIMLATSDARHYCEICDNVYRFTPFELSKEQRKSIHGANEFIEITTLINGINFYKNIMLTIFG